MAAQALQLPQGVFELTSSDSVTIDFFCFKFDQLHFIDSTNLINQTINSVN